MSMCGIMNSLTAPVRRLRHWRGKGVHSPFMYGVVRGVFLKSRLSGPEHRLYDELLGRGVRKKDAVVLQNLYGYCGAEGYTFIGEQKLTPQVACACRIAEAPVAADTDGAGGTVSSAGESGTADAVGPASPNGAARGGCAAPPHPATGGNATPATGRNFCIVSATAVAAKAATTAAGADTAATAKAGTAAAKAAEVATTTAAAAQAVTETADLLDGTESVLVWLVPDRRREKRAVTKNIYRKNLCVVVDRRRMVIMFFDPKLNRQKYLI